MKTTTSFPIILLAFLLLSNLSCKKEERLCPDLHCENGGKCIGDICFCETGFTGKYCEEELVPVQMQISKINVTGFAPIVTSGNSSSDPDPDIYVVIYRGSSVLYRYFGSYDNAKPDETYEFKPNNNIPIHDPTTTYYLALYDSDQEADDLVGEQSFVPYQPGLGFPQVLEFGEEGDLRFELNVQYSF